MTLRIINSLAKTLLSLLLVTMTAQASAADIHYVGGDISMLDKYTEAGAIYIDGDGQVQQPLALFSSAGWNIMRLRLFVNPENATADDRKEGAVQDLAYVVSLGKKIKDAGFSLMLDFHYSDTWTDPGQHSTPAAWQSLSVAERTARIGTYTSECLQAMIDGGATPDFIQPGNEITGGMLWPSGQVYASGGAPSGGSWDVFAGYLKSAIDACHSKCPAAKIVIHTEMHNASLVPSFYNQLAKYPEISYDIIGLSYYPDYHGTLSMLSSTLSTLEQQHSDKQIMIVETGYGFRWAIPSDKDAYKNQYPITVEGQRTFAAELISTLNAHPQVTGIVWWFPEDNLNGIVFTNGIAGDWSKKITNDYWNGSLFDQETGKANTALYELKNFIPADQQMGVSTVETQRRLSDRIYDLTGRSYDRSSAPHGIYITPRGKVIR